MPLMLACCLSATPCIGRPCACCSSGTDASHGNQALLLERRILMLATDSDRVSAAVHAAAALIFPFRWHHIYLPLLPHALQVPPTGRDRQTSDMRWGWVHGSALQGIWITNLQLDSTCNLMDITGFQ